MPERARRCDGFDDARRRRRRLARVDMPPARALEAYGEDLARACDAHASTARAFASGDDDGAATRVPAADAATTRACVAACARLDAEATRGARRARGRDARATTTDSD
jgi:hypothetical protein